MVRNTCGSDMGNRKSNTSKLPNNRTAVVSRIAKSGMPEPRLGTAVAFTGP
jgi:hypothetical protein